MRTYERDGASALVRDREHAGLRIVGVGAHRMAQHLPQSRLIRSGLLRVACDAFLAREPIEQG